MKTDAQIAGIRRTVAVLIGVMLVVFALFYWKLNREAVVKPDSLPAGLVVLEEPRPLAYWPTSERWSVAIVDRADCAREQCNPARPIFANLWQSGATFPRDSIRPVWFAPYQKDDAVFEVEGMGEDWKGFESAGWFVDEGWNTYSHTLLVVNPAGEMTGFVRPPYSPQQILRSLAVMGVRN